jgi:hypothetical protein
MAAHLPGGLRRAGGLVDGLAAGPLAGRPIELVCVVMVVTWSSDEEHDRAWRSVKEQLAFYGSTPAYARVLELHGLGDLHLDLNRLSKAGRWDDMTELIPDDLVREIAVTGERRDVAAGLVARVAGITDSISLVNNRNPDPANFADIVADLRTRTAGG